MDNNKKIKKVKAIDLAYIAMFTAIIVICAQIQLHIGQLTFSLQTMGVVLAATILGWKKGTLSVIIYVLIGLAGLPVFTGFSGGAGVLLGPTGGYIAGFIFSALATGLITDLISKKLLVLCIAMTVGVALCYLFGTIWFLISTQTDFVSALMLCVVPYIPADAAKIAVACLLVKKLPKLKFR